MDERVTLWEEEYVPEGTEAVGVVGTAGDAVNVQPEPAVVVAWLSVLLAPAYHVPVGVATECWRLM